MAQRSPRPGRRHVGIAILLGGLLLLLGWWLPGESDAPGPGPAAHDQQVTGPPSLLGTGEKRSDATPGHLTGSEPDRTSCVVLRDLGTGDPVAGVGVVTQVGGSPVEATSDDAGSVCWSESGELESVVIQSSYWIQATTSEDVRTTGTIWIHGPLALQLHCVDERGRKIPASDLDARLLVLQPPGTGLDRVTVAPWSMGWYRRHGIRRELRLRLDASGRVKRAVRRLRYLGILAQTSTHRSDLVELQVPGGSAPHVPALQVRLRLTPMPRITGRVVSPDGTPVAGAVVQVNVFGDIPMGEAEPTRLRDPGGGMTIVGHPDGSATVKLAREVLTDEDGAYELMLPKRGRCVVQVLKSGFVPRRSRIEIKRDVNRFDAELLPDGDRSRVRLLWRGEPLPAQQLMAGDLHDIREQTSHAVEISDTGLMQGGWLTHGRRYGLVFSLPEAAGGGRECRFLVWDGSVAEIELSAQAAKLDDLR